MTRAREGARRAKNEMLQKATQAVAAAGLAAGGAVVFAGFLALMLAVIDTLMPLLPLDMSTWPAPLIFGELPMLLGVALAGGRTRLKDHQLAPSRTLHGRRRVTTVVTNT